MWSRTRETISWRGRRERGLDSLRVVDRWLFPTSPRPNFDSGATEAVGHGLGIEIMRLGDRGDRGERGAAGVRVGGCRERVTVPLLGDIPAFTGGNRNPLNAELGTTETG